MRGLLFLEPTLYWLPAGFRLEKGRFLVVFEVFVKLVAWVVAAFVRRCFAIFGTRGLGLMWFCYLACALGVFSSVMSVSLCGGLPGLAPAGHSLSLLRQRK
jgi:hypothetical protein